VDSWVRTKDATTESGSDREHIEALVSAKGYRMPEAMIYVRLVQLLDKEKRKELMIIYGEDLAPTGFTTAELGEGGKAHDRWPGIADALLERAERRITIKPTKP
jgi:predicted alternative tryptophan synthase beta-subunit